MPGDLKKKSRKKKKKRSVHCFIYSNDRGAEVLEVERTGSYPITN